MPKRLTITRGMMEDLLYDPVKAAYVFFQIELDAFQAAALRIAWFARVTEIHSGHGSSKTLVNGWIICNLSCVLIPGTVVGVVFQNFQAAKDNYWKYYSSAYMTPLFRAQLGRLEGETGQMKKSSSREPGAWKYHFKSGGRIEMPAPGHIGDADKLGSWEVHRMLIDESNKIRKMGEGIQKQLIGRIRLQPFSREHPVWQNKLWLLGTAETVGHPGYLAHQRYEQKVKRGNPKFWTVGFCFKD